MEQDFPANSTERLVIKARYNIRLLNFDDHSLRLTLYFYSGDMPRNNPMRHLVCDIQCPIDRDTPIGPRSTHTEMYRVHS